MAVSLKFLSFLGTVGAGAGVSAPLTVSYLRQNGGRDVFLVNGKGIENFGLLGRGKRSSLESTDSVNPGELFKEWKKKFRKQVDKKSAKFIGDIDDKFDKYSGKWKEKVERIGSDFSNVKDKLKNISHLQEDLFEEQNKKSSGEFAELEQIVKDIKDTQNNLMHWQDNWKKRHLDPRIKKLEELLSKIRVNGTLILGY